MIAIGSDHAGYPLKQLLLQHLSECDIPARDFGCDGNSIDYPIVAKQLCAAVADGSCERGVLICGTGIGMSMAANKVAGIRAAVCGDTFSARMTRAHNDANVLTLGARVIGPGLAVDILDIFLNTAFEGGRHQTRIDMVMDIERDER